MCVSGAPQKIQCQRICIKIITNISLNITVSDIHFRLIIFDTNSFDKNSFICGDKKIDQMHSVMTIGELTI